MKKILLFTITLFTFASIAYSLAPTQTEWRWRNDDGGQSNATWKADTNVVVTISDESNIRLRIGYVNTFDSTYYPDIMLMYRQVGGDSIDSLWRPVIDNPGNDFIFSNSDNIADGDGTTQQLPTKYTTYDFAPGNIYESSTPFDFYILGDSITEFEFCIKADANADYGNHYQFSMGYADSIPLNMHNDYYPELILEKPVLTITAIDAYKASGTDNPTFSLSYSGFVDGDDEAVLDEIPGAACNAIQSSPVGEYDIVLYGGSDNKYEYNLVDGTLFVTFPVGLKDNKSNLVTLYPNPAQNILCIKSDIIKTRNIEIFDISGRSVLKTQSVNNTIDIHNLEKGLYLVKMDGQVYRITKQ